jgi:hypothetical protein
MSSWISRLKATSDSRCNHPDTLILMENPGSYGSKEQNLQETSHPWFTQRFMTRRAKLIGRKKIDYPPEVIKEVDWQLIGKTSTSIPQTRWHFLSKHIAGMCSIGKCMKRWKEWPTDSCPKCGGAEDAPHVWRCKGEGTSEIWDKSVASLDSLLRKLDTDPTLHHLLLIYLKSWWSGEGVTYVPPKEFQDLIDAQNRISWHRFFEGWLSVQWTQHQQHFYNIIKSSCTGQRWAMAIMQKLWDTTWDLWEHYNGALHKKENLITQTIDTQLNAKVYRVYNQLHSRTL